MRSFATVVFAHFGSRRNPTAFLWHSDPTPAQMVESLETLIQRKYGQNIPTFVRGSLDQALQRAKSEFKFTLIYLHSDKHQNTARFCRLVGLSSFFFPSLTI